MARQVLKRLDMRGRSIVADALHTQRETAQAIIDQGGYYLLPVKSNQPTLREQLSEELLWERYAPYTQTDCGHGRIETRTFRVSPEFNQEVLWLDFPGARVAAQVQREVLEKKSGRKRQTVLAYLLTNLSPRQARGRELLALKRGYGGAIENGVHRVRDGVLREHACRARKSHLPRVLAVFANVALSILRLLGKTNICDPTLNNLQTTLELPWAFEILSYSSEPDRSRRCWRGKPQVQEVACANRRRTRGVRRQFLLRRRAERVERSFAHWYDRGGMRRTHLRGQKHLWKRLLLQVGGFNLSLVVHRQLGRGHAAGGRAAKKALRRLNEQLLGRLHPVRRTWQRYRHAFWVGCFSKCSRSSLVQASAPLADQWPLLPRTVRPAGRTRRHSYSRQLWAKSSGEGTFSTLKVSQRP